MGDALSEAELATVRRRMHDYGYALVGHACEEGQRLVATIDALEARLAAAEKVVEAARHADGAKECANFPPGSKFNCCREPDDGWATTHDPCLFCALAALDALSAPPTDRGADGG